MNRIIYFTIILLGSIISFCPESKAQDILNVVPHRKIKGYKADIFGDDQWYLGYRHKHYEGSDFMRHLSSVYGFTTAKQRPYKLVYSKYKYNNSLEIEVAEFTSKALEITDPTWLLLKNLYCEAAKSMKIADPDTEYFTLDGPEDLYQYAFMGNLGYASNKKGTNCGRLQAISEIICQAIIKKDESMILKQKEEILSLTESFRKVSNYTPSGGYDELQWFN